jgi:quercetin dioxygenase-like cupin family protein
MLKSCTYQKWRPQRLLAFVLLLGLSASLRASVAGTVTSTTLPNDVYPEVRTILSTGSTIIGEPIRYPAGSPALISAVDITLRPKHQTGWHTHPVPLFGYILEGELTVDYGPEGQRIYRKGDALVEAMDEAHNGRNTRETPAKILAVFIGVEGVQGTVPASSPGR